MKACVLVSLRQKFCCSCMADVKKDPYTTIHTNTQIQIHKYKCTNTNTQYVSEYLPVQVWRMSGESIAPNVGVVPSSPFKKPSSGFFFWTNIFSALFLKSFGQFPSGNVLDGQVLKSSQSTFPRETPATQVCFHWQHLCNIKAKNEILEGFFSASRSGFCSQTVAFAMAWPVGHP